MGLGGNNNNVEPFSVIRYNPRRCGPLAQLAEQVTFNHLVGGSSPSWPTKDKGCPCDTLFCYRFSLLLACRIRFWPTSSPFGGSGQGKIGWPP